MNTSTTNTLIGSLFAGTVCFLLGAAFVLIGISTRIVRARRMQSSEKDDSDLAKIKSGLILFLISSLSYFVSYSTYAKANAIESTSPVLDFLASFSVPPQLIFMASWILPCAFALISYLSIRSARWHLSLHNGRVLFSRELLPDEKLIGLGFEREDVLVPVLLIFAPAFLGLPIFIYLFLQFGNSFVFVVAPLVVLSPYFALTLFRYSHRRIAVFGVTDNRILRVENCFDAQVKMGVLVSSAQVKDYLDRGRIDRLVYLLPTESAMPNVDPELLEALKRARAKQAKTKAP